MVIFLQYSHIHFSLLCQVSPALHFCEFLLKLLLKPKGHSFGLTGHRFLKSLREQSVYLAICRETRHPKQHSTK